MPICNLGNARQELRAVSSCANRTNAYKNEYENEYFQSAVNEDLDHLDRIEVYFIY